MQSINVGQTRGGSSSGELRIGQLAEDVRLPNPMKKIVSVERLIKFYETSMMRAVEGFVAAARGGVRPTFQLVADGLKRKRLLCYGLNLQTGEAADIGLKPLEELLPLLQRLGLIRYFDHLVVEWTIREFRRDPHLFLSCEVSVSSAVDDIWWEHVSKALAQERGVASKLIIYLKGDIAKNAEHSYKRYTFIIKQLGCRAPLDYRGPGSGYLWFIVACKPYIMKVGLSLVGGLFSGTDLEPFKIMLKTVKGLAPLVVVDEINNLSNWRRMRLTAGLWSHGTYIGKPQLLGSVQALFK